MMDSGRTRDLSQKFQSFLGEKFTTEKRTDYAYNETLIGTAVFNLSRNTLLEYSGQEVVKGAEGCSFDELGIVVSFNIANLEVRQEYLNFHRAEPLLAAFAKGITEHSFDFRLTLPTGATVWTRTIVHLVRNPKTQDILLFNFAYNINKTKTMELLTNFAVNDDYDLLGCASFRDCMAYMYFGKKSFNIFHTDYVEENYTSSLLRFTQNAIVEEEREAYFAKASLENIRKQLAVNGSFEFYLHMYKHGKINTKKVKYVKSTDDPELFFFTQMDVTDLLVEERKKQDMLTKALWEAEGANHAKTTFLSQMSHEIRTPLNAIIGMAHLAKETETMEEKDEYIDKMHQSGHYLLGVINDILDMSRIESGRFELHSSWNNTAELITSAIDMLEMDMKLKNIHFIRPSLTGVEHLESHVDTLRMRQVYMNLLNNAIKFTPAGGVISLSFRNIMKDADFCVDVVTISDTGCGMSPEFLNKLFIPFEREENTYTRNIQGTGLGLALVKKIVTAMGGTITVESTLGEGTIFTLEIPHRYRRVDKAALKNETHKAQETDLKGKRILLVDDQALNREIALRLLTKRGVIVQEAANGEEAVELYKAHEAGYYDCILMDIRMPVMDGLEATRTIRQLPKADAVGIPILAMTANAFDDDVLETKAAGMNTHLSKPIEPKVLFASIARYTRDK